jgi:hypothetical protein
MVELRSLLSWAMMLAAPVLVAASPGVRAEPVTDQLLSNVSVAETGPCAVVRIDFNVKVQYLNHFPLASGDELRIQVNPLDKLSGDRRPVGTLEALRAPSSAQASIHGIELESKGQTSALTIFFKRTVAFKVAQGLDFKSVVIAISSPKTPGSCEPVIGAGDPSAGLRGSITAPGRVKDAKDAKAAKEAAAGPLTGDRLEAVLVEARTEIEKSNFDRAVQLATKIVEAGETPQRQEAQELLATARERRGQIAHARAEYQEYLRLYPKGPGADRVRGRLAAIEGALKVPGGVSGGRTEAAGAGNAGKPVTLGSDKDKSPATGKSAQAGQAGTYLPETPKPPAEWTVSQYGSLSAFYNLNQGGRGFIEKPRNTVGWDREDPYKTYQNSMLGSLDYDARFDNAAFAGRFRVSASQQQNFMKDTIDETRVATLYLDGRSKESGVSGRVGRQTSTSGGVLGRFDGAVAGYQVSDGVKVNAVAGSPVERGKDTPFLNDRYFYGVSSDLTWSSKMVETSGYFIEQRDAGHVDRQGLGVEARFVKDGLAAYGTVEYDVHFGEFNSAAVTGSKVFADQSTASVNLDYRRSPILLVSNALYGQGVYKLSDLLARYTRSEIDQLALDRTAHSITATAAFSKPLNAWLSWNGDVTVNRLGGMPASGGVDVVHSTGTDTYVASQLVGSNVFVLGDTATGGVRYANSALTDRYLLELGVNYPVTADWRLNPMLRLGYLFYKNETRDEYQILPTVRTSYAVMRDLLLEFEVGGKWGVTNSEIGKEYQTELLVLAGVRYDFSSAK